MEMVLEVLLGGGHVVMEVYKVAEMVTLIKIVIDAIVIEGNKCCWQKESLFSSLV